MASGQYLSSLNHVSVGVQCDVVVHLLLHHQDSSQLHRSCPHTSDTLPLASGHLTKHTSGCVVVRNRAHSSSPSPDKQNPDKNVQCQDKNAQFQSNSFNQLSPCGTLQYYTTQVCVAVVYTCTYRMHGKLHR